MKLLDITIKNFRSIKGDGITLSLKDSDIIFLYGQNNAGKSSLLSAYEYMIAPKKKATLNDFLGFDTNNHIEIKTTFLKEEGDNAIFENKGFNKWVSEDGKIKFRKTWEDINVEGKKETFDPNPEINDYVENGFGGLEQYLTKHSPTPVRIPAFPTPADLTKFIKETIQKSVLKSLKDDEVEAYQNVMNEIENLQERILSNENITSKTDKANDNFRKIFPNLTLEISPIEGQEFNLASTFEKEFSVIIKDDRFPEAKQDFSNHGHGVIRQALFNFLGIVKNDLPTNNDGESVSKEYIILFEEPEVYLHPKAINLLRKVLYELCADSPFQIICASHSPALIDISKQHTTLVRLLREEDGTTKIYQAGDDLFSSSQEIKNKVQMINRFDPNICESFFSNEVILVEGDTEAIVVRELLERKFPTNDIFVVNTGSKNNIPFFQKIFNHFNIKQHIIHDSDTRYNYTKTKGNNGEINYAVKNNNDGNPKNNSAWTINQNIWDELTRGNEFNENLSKRYVSVYDFESSHDYQYDKDKGKPLSAFEYANSLDINSNVPILNFLNMICGETEKPIEYTQEEIDELVNEPNE
ncbi:ATP-dependent endonuclease [Mesonia ostreae]|uniref:AAA family ATPase n=1 Tax=Mesonia ostreae TaxID=861110 RepID=A0ABU2KML5_9FLAO|nr:AAA family ATPase [Mesonia ostreae]MDT0295917.1 AAA family ATPase [Mesonia ostreae]